MEKRTILAFVLSFLVMLAWMYLYNPKTSPPQYDKIQGAQDESVTPLPAQATDPRSALIERAEAEKEILSTEIKETVVETPLYRAVFTNEGPAITSFQLMRYRESADPDSPPFEFVNFREIDSDLIFFHLNNQKDSGKQKLIYNVSRDAIRLTPGSSYMDLTFSRQDENGISIEQTFRFYPDRYDIDVTISLANRSEYPVTGNIEANVNGMPSEAKKRHYSFIGASLLLDSKLEKLAPKDIKSEKTLTGKIDWFAYENEYFISAIVPEKQTEGYFRGHVLPSGIIKSAFISPSFSLNPLEQTSNKFTLFVGPRDIDLLSNTGKGLERAINFGFFDIIAKPLHWLLRFFYRYVRNYGVSIIILTIIVKTLFWPLTQKSHKSMKEMQKIQPLMAKIREKYKDNREQMNKEIMDLYRTYKVNPMGGCLPMLIQIPVFFALFRILGNAIELRHAPFMLWINDLSTPDRLFNFPFSLPFMSPPYGIPVLTLLMGASMFIQQKIQPMAGDPAQAKVMMFLPLIFTIMFINFPSGLVLYWLTQNILTIGQQYLIQKKSD